jgi:hypothetical protein
MWNSYLTDAARATTAPGAGRAQVGGRSLRCHCLVSAVQRVLTVRATSTKTERCLHRVGTEFVLQASSLMHPQKCDWSRESKLAALP